jgi:hypothetical protein
MSRMKKPENETEEQVKIRHIFESVSNHATRSEKTAWERKRTNMDKLIKQLSPLEDKIMEIRAKMEPIYDEIAELRTLMVEECIHPFDMLLYNDDQTIRCKFCEKLLKPTETTERITETALDIPNGTKEV